MDDHRLAGFTLFELLITLSLIGILSGLAVPAYQGLILNNRLRAAAETIADDLRQARREAIMSNRSREVNFLRSSGKHWSYSVSSASAVQKATSSTDFPHISLAQPSFSGTGSIRFTPVRGTANGGRLDLSTSAGKDISIILSPLGRVRLCSSSDARYAAC